MSFAARDLSVLAYANGFTMWHYTTVDNAVTTAGYFDSAFDMVRVGDLMIANIDIDGTLDTKIYTVTVSSDSGVTVSDFSA